MTSPQSATNTLDEAKKAARAEAMARRAKAHEQMGPSGREHAGQALMRNFLEAVELRTSESVSGYWPVKEEIDVKPLLHVLHKRGHLCGLPVIVAKHTPLLFKHWDPERPLIEGRWGIPVPPDDSAEMIPELLLVPLLAFDAQGNRLGYGAGFYDRTISKLRSRARRRPLAVGIAYAAQEVDRVPCDETDERLDWVVTEQSAKRFVGV
ncbi:MAG: 5-formyltetrahydrofolate cyclo-ligase [Alphaproteobacteria bacterium]